MRFWRATFPSPDQGQHGAIWLGFAPAPQAAELDMPPALWQSRQDKDLTKAAACRRRSCAAGPAGQRTRTTPGQQHWEIGSPVVLAAGWQPGRCNVNVTTCEHLGIVSTAPPSMARSWSMLFCRLRFRLLVVGDGWSLPPGRTATGGR
jgi:hypothetical protein